MPLDDGHNCDEVSYAPESLRDPGGDFNLGPKWGSSSVTYGYRTSSRVAHQRHDQPTDSRLDQRAASGLAAVSPLVMHRSRRPGWHGQRQAHTASSRRRSASVLTSSMAASGSNVLAHAYYPGSAAAATFTSTPAIPTTSGRGILHRNRRARNRPRDRP